MKKPGMFKYGILAIQCALEADNCEDALAIDPGTRRQVCKELRAAIRVLRVAEKWTGDDDGFDHEGAMWKAIENARRVHEKGGKK